ncbi:hypothetical protein LY76DRAFT_184677 [Colletotrichum caudatum]|nr:hypothetical protein LY76DRAFT_184677 [Colletotrichum caudatum]
MYVSQKAHQVFFPSFCPLFPVFLTFNFFFSSSSSSGDRQASDGGVKEIKQDQTPPCRRRGGKGKGKEREEKRGWGKTKPKQTTPPPSPQCEPYLLLFSFP